MATEEYVCLNIECRYRSSQPFPVCPKCGHQNTFVTESNMRREKEKQKQDRAHSPDWVNHDESNLRLVCRSNAVACYSCRQVPLELFDLLLVRESNQVRLRLAPQHIQPPIISVAIAHVFAMIRDCLSRAANLRIGQYRDRARGPATATARTN